MGMIYVLVLILPPTYLQREGCQSLVPKGFSNYPKVARLGGLLKNISEK